MVNVKAVTLRIGVTEWSPHKSVQKLSAELGVLHLTMFDHKRDLVMKSFWPVFVIELSDTVMRPCHKACALLLEWCLVALSHGRVLFSEECAVYCSSLSWNVFWGSTESSLHAWDVRPPTTNDDSSGVTASYVIGPYFLMELLVVLHVLNVELCYTRAKHTGVISAR